MRNGRTAVLQGAVRLEANARGPPGQVVCNCEGCADALPNHPQQLPVLFTGDNAT